MSQQAIDNQDMANFDASSTRPFFARKLGRCVVSHGERKLLAIGVTSFSKQSRLSKARIRDCTTGKSQEERVASSHPMCKKSSVVVEMG